MKTIRRDWLIGASILVLMVGTAHAGSDFGTEGGGNQPCKTDSLPANIWSLVSYDNAGQPCLTKPDADQTCDPAATWNWQNHGTVIVTNQAAPPQWGLPLLQQSPAATVQMQLWVGNGGGACYGGTSSPIICDNPATHYLQESETFPLPGRKLDLAIPFEFMIYHAAAWFAVYGDANYFGFWVFVKPSVAAACLSTNYGDLVYKDESQ
jgi:hypothetical protein